MPLHPPLPIPYSGVDEPMSGRVLVTGGAGFFGRILKRFLLDKGLSCVSIDIERDDDSHGRLTTLVCDVRDERGLNAVFSSHPVDAVIHCAAMLAHDVRSKKALWESNVQGTANVAATCERHGVPKVVFISSNCLWARSFGRPVTEEDPPEPKEIYGRSKQAAEDILQSRDGFDSVILRCPTIIDAGRIGLLGILFEFIREGRRVWVVGDGTNRYQFVHAPDLADACLRALEYEGSGLFNVGSAGVPSLRETYEYVIARAGTGARVARLPKAPTLLFMRAFHSLGLSPLGPYQYRMISEDFMFDTSKIEDTMGWSPTMGNERMLWRAYEFYCSHLDSLDGEGRSAHRRPSRMGIIRLLKLIS